jgi:hypothetical protein
MDDEPACESVGESAANFVMHGVRDVLSAKQFGVRENRLNKELAATLLNVTIVVGAARGVAVRIRQARSRESRCFRHEWHSRNIFAKEYKPCPRLPKNRRFSLSKMFDDKRASRPMDAASRK